MPFFTIIIPTFNRASLLGKTVESVLSQRFSDFELLIIDDGSTDNTQEVVELFKADGRVQYFRKNNGERGAARNYGTARANGEYINFFDSDDLMYPNHLEVAHRFIQDKELPEIFHVAYDYKTPDGTLIYNRSDLDERTNRTLLFDNILSCNGVFVRKDIAAQFPFEESRIMASAEDWALWVKLASRYTIQYCNEITSAIVAHDARSIYTINIDKVIARDMFLIDHLQTDEVVVKNYKGNFDKFKAERYTFIMLAYSEQKRSANVYHWAMKAISTYPFIVLSKRFLASIKNTLIA